MVIKIKLQIKLKTLKSINYATEISIIYRFGIEELLLIAKITFISQRQKSSRIRRIH